MAAFEGFGHDYELWWEQSGRGSMQSRLVLAMAVSAMMFVAACGSSRSETPVEANSPTAAPPDEREQVLVELERCDPAEASGTGTNNGERTLNVFIEVTFESASGVTVGDRIARAPALAPGATVEWNAPFLGLGEYETCQARLSSVTNAPQ